MSDVPHWLELKNAAIAAVARGWPITPAEICLDDSGRESVELVFRRWCTEPITSLSWAVDCWRQRPYLLLLVCGHYVDVLDVPRQLGESALPALKTSGTPVAAALNPERWLLFVATDSGALRPELKAASVEVRGSGEWVALPPTVINHCASQWVSAPSPGRDVTLPCADQVQTLLATVLTAETH